MTKSECRMTKHKCASVEFALLQAKFVAAAKILIRHESRTEDNQDSKDHFCGRYSTNDTKIAAFFRSVIECFVAHLDSKTHKKPRKLYDSDSTSLVCFVCFVAAFLREPSVLSA